MGILILFVWVLFFLATAVTSVSGALYPRLDNLTGHPLAILSQAQKAHEVDEAGGEVQLAAVLAGGIVVGESVVVVVKSLTWTSQRNRKLCFSLNIKARIRREEFKDF